MILSDRTCQAAICFASSGVSPVAPRTGKAVSSDLRMPSFADSIFLFVLALLLFGPKKLPVLARELGKWMGEFRRASNEFKMQMDEELRASEQADRQKQIAAMEAAAPVPPPLDEPAEPVHPHLRYTMPGEEPSEEATTEHSILPPGLTSETAHETSIEPQTLPVHDSVAPSEPPSVSPAEPLVAAAPPTADGVRPIPIATSGSLKMMPPATGLPTPRASRSNALSGLVDSIPETSANGAGHTGSPAPETESVAHGD